MREAAAETVELRFLDDEGLSPASETCSHIRLGENITVRKSAGFVSLRLCAQEIHYPSRTRYACLVLDRTKVRGTRIALFSQTPCKRARATTGGWSSSATRYIVKVLIMYKTSVESDDHHTRISYRHQLPRFGAERLAGFTHTYLLKTIAVTNPAFCEPRRYDLSCNKATQYLA